MGKFLLIKGRYAAMFFCITRTYYRVNERHVRLHLVTRVHQSFAARVQT